MIWSDGEERTVHVDTSRVLNYRHQLYCAKNIYQKRIEWLGTGLVLLLSLLYSAYFDDAGFIL